MSPLRNAADDLWTINGTRRDILALTGIGHWGGLASGGAWMAAAFAIAFSRKSLNPGVLYAVCVGLAVALAWGFTFSAAGASFEVVLVHAISFASPSTDVLMFLLSPPGTALTFDLGLIPGVALGAFLAAFAAKEFRLEGFKNATGMVRALSGACLMGFGSVLAGGCAIGAGISGAAVFAVTAWIVLWSMWFGAAVTDYLIDSRKPLPKIAAGGARS